MQKLKSVRNITGLFVIVSCYDTGITWRYICREEIFKLLYIEKQKEQAEHCDNRN